MQLLASTPKHFLYWCIRRLLWQYRQFANLWPGHCKSSGAVQTLIRESTGAVGSSINVSPAATTLFCNRS